MDTSRKPIQTSIFLEACVSEVTTTNKTSHPNFLTLKLNSKCFLVPLRIRKNRINCPTSSHKCERHLHWFNITKLYEGLPGQGSQKWVISRTISPSSPKANLSYRIISSGLSQTQTSFRLPSYLEIAVHYCSALMLIIRTANALNYLAPSTRAHLVP